nr:hypothetical protein [Haladaptatus sp. DYF46]
MALQTNRGRVEALLPDFDEHPDSSYRRTVVGLKLDLRKEQVLKFDTVTDEPW